MRAEYEEIYLLVRVRQVMVDKLVDIGDAVRWADIRQACWRLAKLGVAGYKIGG